MSRKRRLVSMFLLLFAATTAAGAEASRTAEDARGLPRLLAVDAGDLRVLPATIATLSPQLLIESSSLSYDFPVSELAGTDDLGLALAGRRIRFGYLLDGPSQNLVMGGPGGWGATVGFVDGYYRDENYRYYDDDYASREDYEDWERAFRLGLGWRKTGSGGRLFEIGVAGSLIQAERDVGALLLRNGETTEYSLRWKADHGAGFETTLRTLSPDPGLQAALRFRYEDLHPEAEPVEFEPRLIRRGAAADLGWRVDIAPLDDVVIGVTASWWREQETTFTQYEWERVLEAERIRYDGAIFVSVEEKIREQLVVRGGFRGPARFRIDKTRSYEQKGEEYLLNDESRRSTGSTLAPQIYLGAGWVWKQLTVDAQVDRRLDLYRPLIRWSARFEF